jgi:hypothetical protein
VFTSKDYWTKGEREREAVVEILALVPEGST